jgi:hypothetical protein
MTDDDFVYAIRRAERDAGIRVVADTLRVSVPTVGRWAVGKNLPHPGVREAAVKALVAEIVALKAEGT